MDHKIPLLHAREPDAHKGDFGRIFALAGSRGMVGAALLTAESILRGGAGYVKVGMPARLSPLVSANPYTTCVLTSSLPETEDGTVSMMAHKQIMEDAEGYDVMAIGPGISRHKQTMNLVLSLLADPEFDFATVIDADGLYAFAGEARKAIAEIYREKGVPVFTPHPGEFRTLAGLSKPPVDPHVRAQQCREFAGKYDLICVLKGHHTVVSDGERTYVNDHQGIGSGNSGMATAGSGDVLTGLISALRGQGYDSYEAAVLGVYLHALAGDMAAARLGEWSMTAHDLLNHLPKAFLYHFAASNAARKHAEEQGEEIPRFIDPALDARLAKEEAAKAAALQAAAESSEEGGQDLEGEAVEVPTSRLGKTVMMEAQGGE